MSDRLAVFDRGRIEQIGTPAEVYERPATGFVAGFVGRLERLRRRARPAPHRLRRAPSRSVRRRSASAIRSGPRRGAASGATGTIDARSVPRRGHPLHREPRRRRAAPGPGAERRRRQAARRPRAARAPHLGSAGTSSRSRGREATPRDLGRGRPTVAAPAALDGALPPPAAAPDPAPRPAAPLARRRVPRRAARPPRPEPLPRRRVLGAGRARAVARDLPAALHRREPRRRVRDHAHGGRGHGGGGRPRLPPGVLHGALRQPPAEGAALPRRHAPALVQLPRAGLLVEADPRQGGRRHVARRPARPDLAPRGPPGPARWSAGPRCPPPTSAPSSSSSTCGCRSWSCPSWRRSSGCRARSSRRPPTWGRGPAQTFRRVDPAPRRSRASWRDRSSPSRSRWATTSSRASSAGSQPFIGQAVFQHQGTAGNIPMAAALTVVPDRDHGGATWPRPAARAPSRRSEVRRRPSGRAPLTAAAAGVLLFLHVPLSLHRALRVQRGGQELRLPAARASPALVRRRVGAPRHPGGARCCRSRWRRPRR